MSLTGMKYIFFYMFSPQIDVFQQNQRLTPLGFKPKHNIFKKLKIFVYSTVMSNRARICASGG
jgi:hypothetical protein